MFFIGVMSGTSCDGVDVVCVDLSDHVKVVAKDFVSFPSAIKVQITELIQTQRMFLNAFSRLDVELGHFYATVINAFINEHNINRNLIGAIGLHGQTIFHDPGHDLCNTWQIGSAAITATQTGIPTVANFRQMDMANGGQGAPLAPILHHDLFAAPNQAVLVINFGGIANVSLLREGQIIGFDTGPASCLMDEWVMKHLNQDYDEGGQWARAGQVDKPLLDSMLADPYFSKPYPKSTGREWFSLQWLDKHIKGTDSQAVDIQRTLLQLTVESIALGVSQMATLIDQVVCCGGGVHNRFLMETLQHKLGVDLIESTALGVDADYVEATLMAWLAHRRINNQKLNLGQITGVKMPLLYGVVYQP